MPTTFDFIEDTAKSFDFQPDVEESPSQRPVIAFPGERSPRIASTGPLTPFEAGQIPSKVSQALSAPRVPELTGAEAENLLMTPQVTIPNPVPPSWPIARGLVQTAKSIPEFLTAPAAPEILMAQRIPFVREAIDAAIGAGMVKSAAELAGESSVTGDREKMTEAISSGVLGATMIGAPHVAPMVANEVAARRVGRPDLTQVDVEAFPGPANIIRIPDVVEQAQRGGLFTQEALQGAKTVTAPVPRGPRPFVPETPPEIERGLTVIQEIRAKGADTKEKIRALFPQLSRETAAKLRNQAFPREKIPDNLSRQDVDRLFLDKLNEESNREIEQAFQEKAPEPVPQVPATPTPTPSPEPPPTTPEAKAPEVGPVELNGTKFSQHSHALVSKDPVSGKWRLTVFDEFTGTGEIIPAGHEEYASRQDALDSAKELEYAEKPSEPTPPAKVESPAAKKPYISGVSAQDKGISQAEKEFRSTGEGQKAMANRASRIAVLNQMNEAIRKVDPNEAYDKALIEQTPDSQINSMMETLRQGYNRLAAKRAAKEPVRRENYIEIQREREAALAERAKQVEVEETQRYAKQEQDAQPVIDILRQVSGEKHPVTGIATDRGGNIWSEAVDGKFTQDQLNAARSWLVRNGTTDTRLLRAIEGATPKPAAKPAAETGKEMGEESKAPEPTELYLSWSPKEGGTIMGENRRSSVDVISWAKQQIESLRQEVKDYRAEEQKNRQAYKESPNRRVMGGLAPESLRAAGAKAKKLKAQAKIDFLKSRIEEHQRQIKATTKPSETPPTGPGMADLGAATPANFPDAPSNFRHWWDVNFGKPAAKVVPTIKALWNGHQIREGMAYLKDWVENGAKLFARSTANDIRQPLRRLSGKEFKLADNALSMVIEAKGKPEALDEMRIKLIDSTKADPWWRKQALDALDYAVYHWNELNKLADDYKGITSTQVDVENASNIPTLRREGYVPHRQEIEELDLLTTSGQGQSTFFEKPRAHDTFADSIAAGVDPKSLSATDLLEHRLSSGTRLVNSRKWMDTLRGWKDPTTGAPIATNLQPLKRADGSTVMVPPTGYVSEMVGPHSVAILKGYEGTFNALTDPSFFTKNMAGRAFMTANATGKSINLLIDTFHLGRLAFWDSLIKGLGVTTFKAPFPSYRRGLTMLDYTAAQIREMAAKGEIPQKWLGEMLEDKRRLDLAVKSGYNVGRISDALYQDVIHSLPVVGKFNKWLFDQFQRGAMAESWLLEFERARRASPKMSEEAIAREVTKDLNVRFGNLGRQGWFKSRTAQDAARILFLAPQWNEGLIKSELGAVREAGRFAMDAATGKRIFAGTLLRSVGAMALMQFAANQIINQATRGKFTWENEEEGWGSKLSAWVPDIAGNGPGFFLHPLGLAAETTHLLTNLFERSGGDTSKMILDYARSRSSAAMRPVLTLLTRTDFLGHHIKPDNLWGEVVKSAIPTPIAGKAVTAMGKQMVTGQPSEQYAGQFQKQAMQSMGIRTEGAPSPEQRINRLAQEWRREKGVPQNVAMLGVGDYQPLIQAVRIGNMVAAQAEIDRLREKHTDEDIKKHFRKWQKDAFSGSHAREREFRSGLTPVQDIAYIKARDDRERVASEVRGLLR